MRKGIEVRSHPLTGINAFVLFALFAVMSLMTFLLSFQSYTGITKDLSTDNDARLLT